MADTDIKKSTFTLDEILNFIAVDVNNDGHPDAIAIVNPDGSALSFGAGDMLKSTYDTGDNGIVDKAENIDDGAGNAKSAAEVKTHLDGNGSDHSDVVANTAVKHTQGTDSGTNGADFAVGPGTDVDITLTAQNADANKPKLKYNKTTNKWQFSNDGTTWNDIGVGGIGLQDLWIPAAAFSPTVSNGCSNLARIETTAGRPDIKGLYFDPDSDEHTQADIRLPKRWNAGTVTVSVHWTILTTQTNVVRWGAQGVCVGNDDTHDVVFGTAVEVDDTGITAEDEHVVTTGNLTIASAAKSKKIILDIFRNADHANDTLTIDAIFLGVSIHWTSDAGNDA